jgi:hypothetical protein
MSSARIRRAIALVVVAAALVWVGAAQALTITPGIPDLVARVLVVVPVTVTCEPFSPGLTVSSQFVTVRVEQAAGKEIAFGTGTLGGTFDRPLFPCDGAEHTVSVSVLADPAGPPFHGGRAVLTAGASAQAGVPLPCCPGAFGPPFEFQQVSVAPIEVRLR